MYSLPGDTIVQNYNSNISPKRVVFLSKASITQISFDLLTTVGRLKKSIFTTEINFHQRCHIFPAVKRIELWGLFDFARHTFGNHLTNFCFCEELPGSFLPKLSSDCLFFSLGGFQGMFLETLIRVLDAIELLNWFWFRLLRFVQRFHWHLSHWVDCQWLLSCLNLGLSLTFN